MARPIKHGFDYYPLSCSVCDRERYLLSKLGPLGFGLYVRICQELFSVGCCYRFGEVELASFCFSNNVKQKQVIDSLEVMFCSELFNREIYEEQGFLTSKKIQEQYLELCFNTRRKRIEMPRSVLLVPEESLPQAVSLIEIENRNRKGKRKETRNNPTSYSNIPENPVITLNPAKTLDKVAASKWPSLYFTVQERQKLKDRYIEEGLNLEEGLDILQAYSKITKSKFSRYTSHYDVMIGWVLVETRKRENEKLKHERNINYLGASKR